MTQKCCLQKSAQEFVKELLRRLPVECVKQLVEEYQGAQQYTPAKKTFLVSRDVALNCKWQAARPFLQWGEETYGPVAPKQKED